MKPLKIKVEKNNLKLLWSEIPEVTISLIQLRNDCPCAGCKGETILWKKFEPNKTQDLNAEGRYEISSLKTVGGYALQVKWKDGHDTGIYSWDYLKNISSKVSHSN